MTARTIATWFAAACALVAPGVAYGQAEDAFCDANCYHEQQWFAPVDFDFECQPIDRDCGWVFSFESLSWATTGERTPIGTGAADDASLGPFRHFVTGNAGDLGIPPNNPNLMTNVTILPPGLFGGIDSGPPQAKFAWGERYDIGYFNGDSGWSVGVLDGPEASTGQLYGLETQNQLYGSVLVVFDDPLNLMFGYIDVDDGLLGDGGPFSPDGIADDIDKDGQFGPDGYDLDEPVQVPDVNFPGDTRGDADDLVRLPTSWQFLSVRNHTKTAGIELMKTYRLSNLHKMTKHQNNQVEIGAGVRYMMLRDEFMVDGEGGVMGLSSWDTQVDNNLVGPQITANWIHRRHRMQFDVNGRLMFAANVQNFDQDVAWGQDLIPGQYNRSLFAVATVADHGKQENTFSPLVELRAQGSYRITSALSLKLGYTAIFIDNISRSANQVRYELPRFGFRDDQAGKQEILINGVNGGFELVF
jgi:hypothetical protein